MGSIPLPQNPGLGGLDELTTSEEFAVQTIAALGTAGQVLRTNLAETGIEWANPGAATVEGTDVLSTGEVGGTKFLREDGDGTCSWQAITGGGDVTKVGTPADNQVGVWTGDGTIEGDAALTFNTATDTLTSGKVTVNGASGNLTVSADTDGGDFNIASDSNGTLAIYGSAGNVLNVEILDGYLQLTPQTATTVPYLDADKRIVSSAVTPTELGYVSGVTSAIQTQLGGKQATLSGASLTGATVAVDDKVLIQDTNDTNNLKTVTTQAVANLATPEGTAIKSTGEVGGTKFLREDGDGTCSWQTVVGGGNVSKVGTPIDNQIGVWTGDGTIEGDTALTFDTATNTVTLGAEDSYSTIKGIDATTADTDGCSLYIESGAGNGTGLSGEITIRGEIATLQTTDGNSGLQVSNTAWYLYSENSTYDFASLTSYSGILEFTDIDTSNKTFTFPNTTGNVVVDSATQTLTNKRVTPRVITATSYTTDTGTSLNADNCDIFSVTAQAGALLFNAPGGTPTDGQKLIITVASSTTTARALTWNAIFEASTVALPTTTAATTAQLNIGFIYSAGRTKWICLAVA